MKRLSNGKKESPELWINRHLDDAMKKMLLVVLVTFAAILIGCKSEKSEMDYLKFIFENIVKTWDEKSFIDNCSEHLLKKVNRQEIVRSFQEYKKLGTYQSYNVLEAEVRNVGEKMSIFTSRIDVKFPKKNAVIYLKLIKENENGEWRIISFKVDGDKYFD